MSMSSPRPIQEPASHRRPKRDLLVLLGLMVLFVFGFIGLAASIGWEETIQQLQKLSPIQIVGLLSLALINYILRGVRWHLFSRRLGLPLELRHNLLHFVGGFAMTITPGRIGELVRLRWISRMTDWPFERILPLPFIDRVFDIAGMGIVLAGGVVLSQTGTAGAVPVAALAVGFAAIVTRPVLLAGIVKGLWKFVGRWPRRFVRLLQAARSMSIFSAPSVALPALGLSIIGWAAEGYSLYLLLTWMGADISIAAATVIFLFATLAGGLTGAPGGMGGAEAAMLFLLAAQNVPLEVAVPAMAIIRITTLWFAIFIGMVTFPIAEKLSMKV